MGKRKRRKREREREGENKETKRKRGEVEGGRNAQRGKQLSFPLIYFRHK